MTDDHDREGLGEAVHDALTGVPVGEVAASADPAPPSAETVEAVVRRQMAASLGGRRGMIEAGVPSLVFTVLWLTTKDLRLSLLAAGGLAVVALVVRVVQRSTMQYVLNAIFGIAIGWVFVRLAAHGGGDATQQALAYFLPGILISGVESIVIGLSCVVRWPVVGFMVGSAMGDPVAWHEDDQIVRLCTRLTWLLIVPGGFGALTEGAVWLMGHGEVIAGSTAVGIIAFLRYAIVWPLRIGSWALMIWLLARNATPITPAAGSSSAVAGGGEQPL